MGHRSYDETMASARAASLIVVPSKWEEPCGTVILEALRLGKPCLALRRGGTPELAIYGAPGQLMLFEDLQGMADGLLQFLKQDAVALETAAGESADISRQLPALLALYRAGGYTKYA
jgi:glycosyltransferase involved in cell wall biosynthesis